MRVLAVALCLAPLLGACSREQPAPSASDGSDRPRHLLVLFSDQHRFDVLSCEDHPRVRTPNLDRLAAEGTRLSRVYVQAAQCVPSRAALLTGSYPALNGVASNRNSGADLRLPTFGHALSDQGFTVKSVGRMHGVYAGFDHRGILVGESIPRTGSAYGPSAKVAPVAESPVALEEYYDHRIANAAIEELTELGATDDPFVLFVGFHAPHPPFWIPPEFLERHDPADIEVPPFSASELDQGPEFRVERSESRYAKYAESERRAITAGYLGAVELLDFEVGRVLDALDELGLGEDTLVLYTSDHGDLMGEHGLFGKFVSFYEGEVRVPAILRAPEHVPAGGTVDAVAEAIDLVPTVFGLLGAETLPSFSGVDFGPVLAGKASSARSEAFGQLDLPKTKGYLVCDGRYKLAEYVGERGELFDLDADPGERRNLHTDPEHLDVRTRLRERMLVRLGEQTTALRAEPPWDPGDGVADEVFASALERYAELLAIR